MPGMNPGGGIPCIIPGIGIPIIGCIPAARGKGKAKHGERELQSHRRQKETLVGRDGCVGQG
jgi:hypothetical protein